MRQLFPTPVDHVDPAWCYAEDRRPTPSDRPWVALGMIASVDGATAVDGRSGGLGGPADRAVFRAVRAIADVIVVAAGTARAERYGAPTLDESIRELRRDRGQDTVPRLAVITRTLDLDLDGPLFADRSRPPLIITVASAPEDRRRRLEQQTDVTVCGEHDVDVAAALAALASRYQASVVVSEGGPSLNGALVGAGLVDEVCLSLSPVLVGGTSSRIAHGGTAGVPTNLELTRVLEADGMLFLRYARR